MPDQVRRQVIAWSEADCWEHPCSPVF